MRVQIDLGMLRDRFLQSLSEPQIRRIWEEPPRAFFRKPFLFLIGVTNGHVPHRLLQPVVLFVRMRLDEQSGPALKADRRQAGDLRSFIIVLLDQMMLTAQFTIDARDGTTIVIKDAYVHHLAFDQSGRSHTTYLTTDTFRWVA